MATLQDLQATDKTVLPALGVDEIESPLDPQVGFNGTNGVAPFYYHVKALRGQQDDVPGEGAMQPSGCLLL